METELRTNLLACATAYASVRGIELGTIGRLAANDWSFFERISDPSKTFTTRTYDRVMGWLSSTWPDGAVWPESIHRPATEPQAIAS